MKSRLIILTLFVTSSLVAQGDYGFGEGRIVTKEGRVIEGFVELQMTYGSLVAYKTSKNGIVNSIKANQVKSIKTPYKHVENISLSGEEKLMSLEVDGDMRLFTHVQLNRGVRHEGISGTIEKYKAPKITYAISKADNHYELNEDNYELVIRDLSRDCMIAHDFGDFTLDNLKSAVVQYNHCILNNPKRTITAQVVDWKTQQPVRFAHVFVNGRKATTTNYGGFFQLVVRPINKLTLSHVSYEPSIVNVPETNLFKIALNPKAKRLNPLTIDQDVANLSTITDDYYDQSIVQEDFAEARPTIGWESFYKRVTSYILSEKISKDDAFKMDLKFTVGSDSLVREIQIDDDSGAYRNTVEEAISQIDHWIPASQEGVPVEQTLILSVELADQPVTIVDTPASFDGGLEGLYEYMKVKMKYPREAQRLGIQGRVFVEFIIEKDGSITNIKVLRGIGGGCDEEAVRMLQSSPKWKPAMKNGVPVRHKMIQNILFKFKDEPNRSSKARKKN